MARRARQSGSSAARSSARALSRRLVPVFDLVDDGGDTTHSASASSTKLRVASAARRSRSQSSTITTRSRAPSRPRRTVSVNDRGLRVAVQISQPGRGQPTARRSSTTGKDRRCHPASGTLDELTSQMVWRGHGVGSQHGRSPPCGHHRPRGRRATSPRTASTPSAPDHADGALPPRPPEGEEQTGPDRTGSCITPTTTEASVEIAQTLKRSG